MRGWPRRALAVAGAAVGVVLLAASLTGCSALGSALAPGGLLPVLGSMTGGSMPGGSMPGGSMPGGSMTGGSMPATSTPAPPQHAGASTPAPLQHYSNGATSERGNIPKVVGQKAGILSSNGQSHVVTFTVTRIVTDPRCLNEAAPAPANGHYVEVDLDVVTTADMGVDGNDPTVTFTRDNWFFYPPDGDGLIAGGLQAFAAADDCELSVPALPDTIGASQTVSGSVLLDVRPGSVYLSYNTTLGCGCEEGWEWPYSDK